MSAKKQEILGELAAIRRVQSQKLSFHGREDRTRLAKAWETKVAELVELELAEYARRRK